MPAVAHKLGPGTLKIGPTASATEFSAQLTKTALTPEVETEDNIDTLSGEIVAGEDTFTWELSGTMLQDYNVGSLMDYCFTNRGTSQPFEFYPNNSAKRGWKGTLRIRPVQVGGDVKTRNTSDFTFPLVGEPSFLTKP